jgi:chromosome partitioning protein
MSCKTIVVANCKGGTGKTTTTVNVASELAHLGFKVLVVDLDPQGHAGLGFGVTAARAEATSHALFRGPPSDITASVRRSAIAGVDVLPADPDFKIHSAFDEPGRLAAALHGLGGGHDVVVIDTPPSADLPLVAALTAADCVLIPTQLNHLAYRGVQQFTRLCFRVILERNPGLGGFALVPVQLDPRINLQRAILARMFLDFGPERVFRAIRSDIALAEAFGVSRPCATTSRTPAASPTINHLFRIRFLPGTSTWRRSKPGCAMLNARSAGDLLKHPQTPLE